MHPKSHSFRNTGEGLPEITFLSKNDADLISYSTVASGKRTLVIVPLNCM